MGKCVVVPIAKEAEGPGVGTGSTAGILKLSDSIVSSSGVSGGTAATPAAVMAAINAAKLGFRIEFGSFRKGESSNSHMIHFNQPFNSPPVVLVTPMPEDYSPHTSYVWSVFVRNLDVEYRKRCFAVMVRCQMDGTTSSGGCWVNWMAIGT